MRDHKIQIPCDILQEPHAFWEAEKILTYFQQRKGVVYFPVADEDETIRRKIDNILENYFEFNHETHRLPDHFDWKENPSTDVEWAILLHKFYYAVGLGMAYEKTKDARYRTKWIALTSTWIETVPQGFLSSDVAGRRIQNWIYAHYYFVTLSPDVSLPADFYLKFLNSIHDQVEYLIDHISPSRNHRTLELYAVFLAAIVFPEFKKADHWLSFSRTELLKNIQTDILSDGVHCELSTDYHHIVLKNYLNIRKLATHNGIVLPEEMDTRIRKALDFALYVHKPDGIIPSLSDGDSRSFLDLLETGHQLYDDETMQYAASKGQSGHPPQARSKVFPEGGYVILRSGWGTGKTLYEDELYLVFDCGPLGRGNHGHLDLLSFEMAAYGQSLVVDPGRYTYDESGEINWRVRFRGTGYHNTVCVDGKNQTSYLPGKIKYKIRGPAPEHHLASFVSRAGFDYLHGISRSHEYEAIHERKIFFVCPEYWLVSDILRAKQVHDYDLFFHLSDEAFEKVTVSVEDQTRLVHAPHLLVAQATSPDIKLYLEAGHVSRRYGKKHPAPILRFASQGKNRAYHTVLYPYQTQPPEISVKYLPVTAVSGNPVSDLTSALCVTFKEAGKMIQDIFFTVSDNPEKGHRFGRFQYNGQYLFVRSDMKGTILCVEGESETTLLASGKTISLKKDSA
ncbi:MAG: alginate lyase family protein [Nitrospiria bacterium]